MISSITEQDVDSVILLTREIQGIRYFPSKKAAVSAAIGNMSDSAKLLLTFSCWQCLFNTRSKVLDVDRICFYDPAEVNSATFKEFITFLRRHDNVRISPSKEKPLLKFMSRCDAAHREFYVSLLTKEWVKTFPVVDLQEKLNFDFIRGEQVYGEVEYLEGSLTYPVAVRRIPDTDVTPYLLLKEPLRSVLFLMQDQEYVRAKKGDFINTDLKLSARGRYSVSGVIGGDICYPMDYFQLTKEEAEFAERIANLNSFLAESMQVYTDTSEVMLANSEQELARHIAALATDLGEFTALVGDTHSAKRGRFYRVTGRCVQGIVEKVTSETSVSVWFNGALVDCAYPFNGREQALLGTPELLKDKVIEFCYVTLGNTEYSIGHRIMWHQPRWREMRLRGSGEWIEKCALCGSTKNQHANRGVCRNCEPNLHYYYKTYGTDTWINPSPQMRAKRSTSAWGSSLLNLVGYRYKGTVIEAREDGCWRFKTIGE